MELAGTCSTQKHIEDFLSGAQIIKEVKAQKGKKHQIETARSARSSCKRCKEKIPKGELRIGVVTFVPHFNTSWYHLCDACLTPPNKPLEKCRGWEALSLDEKAAASIYWNRRVEKPRKALVVIGDMDLCVFSKAITSRYFKFRSFTFGLSSDRQYSTLWNWRCFLATMIVCNTKELDMLAATSVLFREFSNPSALLKCLGNRKKVQQILGILKTHGIRHAKRKTVDIIRATYKIENEYGGKIPKTRSELLSMRGVGRHVSSVTMAWVHEKAEFGVDVHVRRILERWGFIPKKCREIDIETFVKDRVPKEEIGHFSRSLVDLGQEICGYVPDCEACWARGSCPSASNYIDIEW